MKIKKELLKQHPMQKMKIYFALAIALVAKSAFAQPDAVIKEYILKYKDIAIEEMKRTGIPASITLAQGVHETFAGQSVLVLKSNNHFGIKCKSTWTGESVSHDDDAPGECFRKYPSAIDSYRDHSDFLKNGARYAFLFRLEPTDYEGWAWGLKKAGYATNSKYPQILIKLIRDYQLHDYTLIAMGQKADGPDVYWVKSGTPVTEQPSVVNAVVRTEVQPEVQKVSYPTGTFKINDTKVIYVPRGTSFLSIANEHRIPLHRLFDFNDLHPQEMADRDQLIYLQRKRKSGNNDFHTVRAGESLLDIAQLEGIRLESLLAYNFLKADMQPEAGQNLYLRHKAPSMPKLTTAVAGVSVINTLSNNIIASASGEGNNAYLVHVVQPKETVYSISKKYAVSMDDVRKWNDLSSFDLKTGQQLRIKKM